MQLTLAAIRLQLRRTLCIKEQYVSHYPLNYISDNQLHSDSRKDSNLDKCPKVPPGIVSFVCMSHCHASLVSEASELLCLFQFS